MVNLLKNVGKGILYIIGLPFFLIVLAGTAVVGLLIIVYMFIKSIFLFFTGRSLNDELPEDRKAREIKESKTQMVVNNNPIPPAAEPIPAPLTPASQPTTQTIIKEQPNESVTIEEAVFGSTTTAIPEEEIPFEEPVKEEPIKEEPQKPTIQETIIDTSPEEEPKPKKENKMGEYKPHTASNRVIEDFEDEEESNGVTITFGGDDE